MIAVIDCGNTGLKVYLVDDNNKIIAKSKSNVGVKQTADDGNNSALKQGIVDATNKALQQINKSIEDIKYIVAYGMITSELGIMEVPHIDAPVSIHELAENVVVIKDDKEIFPLNVPLILIRGIKNPFNYNSISEICKADLMRGEEAQAAGVISSYDLKYPLNILELGSTTKFIHVNKEGRIAGSITSLSGQVYGAVLKETFIGKCVKKQDDTKDFFSEKIFNVAVDCVERGGLLRTILLTRFSEILLPTKWYEREFFVGSAIAADDIKVFKQAKETMGFDTEADFVIIGQKNRCKLYEYLLKNKLGHKNNILKITDSQEIDLLGIKGAINIARKASKTFL